MTHIVISSAVRPAHSPLIGRIVAGVRTSWNRFREERRLRATIRTLHWLDDDALKDIGLERDTIEMEVRSRFLER